MTLQKDLTVLAALEFNSVAIGITVLDQMVKTAPVSVLEARTVSSGKYLIIFTGDVASVEYSYDKALETGSENIIDKMLLPMVHKDVLPAIGNNIEPAEWETIGIIETTTLVAAIEVADVAAKTGGVMIVGIRTADGYGGKSFVKIMGSLDAVEAAMEEGLRKAEQKNALFAKVIIPQPHIEIKQHFIKTEANG